MSSEIIVFITIWNEFAQLCWGGIQETQMKQFFCMQGQCFITVIVTYIVATIIICITTIILRFSILSSKYGIIIVAYIAKVITDILIVIYIVATALIQN